MTIETVFSVGSDPRLYSGDLRPAVRLNPIFLSERTLHKDYYARVQLKKESLVVGLKGPDAKTNLLLVNRQS
jgi:hypothetical protein